MSTTKRSHHRSLERRAKASIEPLPSPVLDGFRPEQVAFASRAWTLRGAEEHRSASVFAEAVSLLVDTGAPLEIAAAVARIASDEIAHATLCERMARIFATEPPRFALRERPPRGGAARARRILLVEGAIGETISCALFRTAHRAASEPCTRAALGRILRDEAIHARVCWDALAVLRRDWSVDTVASLTSEAGRALVEIEATQMGPVVARLRSEEPFDPAWARLGVLAPEARAEAFYGAIERRVLPGLRALGLDAASVWDAVLGRGLDGMQPA